MVRALTLAVLSCACQHNFAGVAGWKKVRYAGKRAFVLLGGHSLTSCAGGALSAPDHFHNHFYSSVWYDAVLGYNWPKQVTEMSGKK